MRLKVKKINNVEKRSLFVMPSAVRLTIFDVIIVYTQAVLIGR